VYAGSAINTKASTTEVLIDLSCYLQEGSNDDGSIWCGLIFSLCYDGFKASMPEIQADFHCYLKDVPNDDGTDSIVWSSLVIRGCLYIISLSHMYHRLQRPDRVLDHFTLMTFHWMKLKALDRKSLPS
ncbi:unnamed protein product, partial [Prorocentrum cordatum]